MRRIVLLYVAAAVCRLAAQPQISSIGSAASYRQVAAPGSIVSIFGREFSDAASIRVTVCDRTVKSCTAAAVLFAGPTQINFVLPEIAHGLVTIFVTNSQASPAMSQPYSLEVINWAPDIFLAGYDASIDPVLSSTPGCVIFSCSAPAPGQPLRASMTDAGGELVSSKNPARLGSYYSLWLTGLGISKDGASPRTVAPKMIQRGTNAVVMPKVSFAGRAPGAPGLDQINLYLPPGAYAATCEDQNLEFLFRLRDDWPGSRELVSIPLFVPADCQPGTFNLNGSWTVSLKSWVLKPTSWASGTMSTASGAITQGGSFLSGSFRFAGTECAASGALQGTIVENGQIEMTLEQKGQLVKLTGTVSSDQKSANGTYTSAEGGCTDGDTGTWSATRS